MKPRRPWVSVEIEPPAAWVRGAAAKELIEACGGRAQWSARRRAWNTSADVGRDVIAAAEHGGYAVALSQGGGHDAA